MLSEKDVIFEWTGDQQVAFEQLKKLLTRTPILAYPKDGCPYILDTDASNVGLGGVLSQVQDAEERVIAYASKTLNRAQRNYCVTCRELLAIVTFVKQFHHYLYGAPFLVRTGHAALYWLLRKNDPDGQMARWIEVLQNYDMTVEHRPGKKHGNADALSRCMFGCQHTDTLNLEPGNRADLKKITKRAQKVFPEWPPQEYKELLCQADPGQSSQEAQQLAIQNAKLQPVQTRAQARKDRQQAQQEADLALDEFFGGRATEPRLSAGISTESPSPAPKTVQEPTKAPFSPDRDPPSQPIPVNMNLVDKVTEYQRVQEFLKQEIRMNGPLMQLPSSKARIVTSARSENGLPQVNHPRPGKI